MKNKSLDQLDVGDVVRVHGSSLVGTIRKVDLKRKQFEIESNGISIKVEMHKVSPQAKKPERPQKISIPSKMSDKIPVIDLHGMTKSEAEDRLLCFLNEALLKNCRCIEIIHGHGEGILRAHVHAFLKRSVHVAECRYKDNNTGTTIAYLK